MCAHFTRLSHIALCAGLWGAPVSTKANLIVPRPHIALSPVSIPHAIHYSEADQGQHLVPPSNPPCELATSQPPALAPPPTSMGSKTWSSPMIALAERGDSSSRDQARSAAEVDDTQCTLHLWLMALRCSLKLRQGVPYSARNG